MTIEQLQADLAKLQASLAAWMQERAKAEEQIVMHRGQIALIEEWIRRMSTTPPATNIAAADG